MSQAYRYILSDVESREWNHADPDMRQPARERIVAAARKRARKRGCGLIQIFDIDEELLATAYTEVAGFVSRLHKSGRLQITGYVMPTPRRPQKPPTYTLNSYLFRLHDALVSRYVRKALLATTNVSGRKEKSLEQSKVIYASMTPEERKNPRIIDASRRRRIAEGSGTTVDDVQACLDDFFAITGIEERVKRARAIVSAMTTEEKREPRIIDTSRCRRIARGSGTTIADVHKLLRDFFKMQRRREKDDDAPQGIRA